MSPGTMTSFSFGSSGGGLSVRPDVRCDVLVGDWGPNSSFSGVRSSSHNIDMCIYIYSTIYI
jgi:hypothetical protein